MCGSLHCGATSESSTPRVTHGLSHTFQSTERADGSQHMRRLRALLAAGLNPPMHSTLVQEEIEQAPFCFMSQQATAKFGEDRVG
jgi:hypothetical protein